MIDYIGQNKIAQKWLLEYPERKQAYMEQRSEFTVLSAARMTGLPTGTDISMPTQNKVMALDRLEESRLWLQVVEDTEKVLGEKKLALLDARRWVEEQRRGNAEVGRPGWVEGTGARYADWHMRRYDSYYEPTRKTLFIWWDEIINIAVRIAIKRGCL